MSASGRSLAPPALNVAGQVLVAASGNVANAAAVASLPANAGIRNWCTGFEVTAAGATAASVVNVTLSGLAAGNLVYSFVFPAGVTAQAQPLIVAFPLPLPAIGPNVAVTLTVPAGGAGNTNAACVLHGFQQ
jgi:hypothetical protein